MSGLVDTSVIVRYLTGDPPHLADRAAALLDREEDLEVTDVALVEAAHVLTSVYGVPREVAVDSLTELLQKENIRPRGLDRATVLEGLLLCRPSGRVSFADALIWAAARSAGIGRIYTFDGRFPGAGVSLRN
ncbi:MAG: PIN domain-containing protein [Deferrisomatales bacterium]|nr:PIN domain-containing protein [Deferrisomatales bacterium]